MMNKILYGLTAVAVGIAIGFVANPTISSDNVYDQIRKFQHVFGTAVRNYVDEVDTQKLTESAIKGMLEDLDPHSVYIDADEMKRVNEDFQGSFEGIGVEFDIINDTITIITPISGGPSELLGILGGDKIVTIDGEDAIAIPRSEVPKKLKGPKGTKVTVEIKRIGMKDLISFTITRDKIPLHTNRSAYIIDDTDIGYVSVGRFAQNTYDEMMEAAMKLKKQGMKKMILDLRGNPGGYLSQAVLMADEFVKGGDTIVYTKGRRPEFDESYMSTGGGKLEDIPLIVMIDESSASASEIVSGSIQDMDRGLIVGTTSFGKGLVQRQYPVGDGSAFRLTISRYYTTAGRSIQRPYKDKDAYRKLVGRLDLDEGMLNQSSSVEDYLKKLKADHSKTIEKKAKSKSKDDDEILEIDSLPIYHTRGGRLVLGGGGVTPDFIVKRDTSTLTKLGVELRMKRLFYNYTSNYLGSKDGKKMKEKYENNFSDFLKNFNIEGKLLDDFVTLAKKEITDWNEEEYAKDKFWIEVSIKSNFAKLIWGQDEQSQVFNIIDRQLQKAITLFPEAEKFTKK